MLAQGLETKVIRHVSSYRLDFRPMDGDSQANFMQKRGEEYTRKRHNIAVLKGIGVGLGLFPCMEGISADFVRRFAWSASHSLFALAIIVEFVIMAAPILA